eukprot:GHVT01033823.1.p1 GENE.GHVT01033823.1~~GHVT01033823.1.p1  ORF type:complete len:353 (-),score=98.28 GHVT01033823.1:983-2041(-)
MRDLFLPPHNPRHRWQLTDCTQERSLGGDEDPKQPGQSQAPGSLQASNAHTENYLQREQADKQDDQKQKNLSENPQPHQKLRKNKMTIKQMKNDLRHTQSGNSMFPWPFNGRVDYIFAVDELRIPPGIVSHLLTSLPPEVVLGAEWKHLDIPVLHDGALTCRFETVNCLGLDIITQKFGLELSDHWPLVCRFFLGGDGRPAPALPPPLPNYLHRGMSFGADDEMHQQRSSSSSSAFADRLPGRSSSVPGVEEEEQKALAQKLSVIRRVPSLLERKQKTEAHGQAGREEKTASKEAHRIPIAARPRAFAFGIEELQAEQERKEAHKKKMIDAEKVKHLVLSAKGFIKKPKNKP